MCATKHLSRLILCLTLLSTVGCSSSSPDEINPPQQDGQIADTPDASQDIADAIAYDQGIEDAQSPSADAGSTLQDGSMPADAFLDQSVPDAAIPQADSMLPPAACVNRPERSCTDICNQLTDCLVGDGCLGIQPQDQSQLLASCERSCGFNTNTRNLLCSAETLTCDEILDSLYESDEALNALCNYEESFSPEQQDNCRAICEHTASCTTQMGLESEPPQACRFQCLSAANYDALDCVTGVVCDERFEAAVQACVQGRRSFPPLITDCTTLCDEITSCSLDVETIFGETDNASCIDLCTSRLTTSASIACVGEKGCALTNGDVVDCIGAQIPAPDCRLTCLRILECTQMENPFGVTEQGLNNCTASCSMNASATQRSCTFELPCTENYSEALNACSMD